MFADRVVVITGGSSGLGKELAARFLKAGAKVALIARDAAKLEAVKDELGPAGKAVAYSADVADSAAVDRAFRAIAAEVGPPDVLVNCAGILHEATFADEDPQTFRAIMDINFFGTVHCVRAVLPFFRERRAGRIVNVSSMAGRMGTYGYSAYCASKHAVVGLTESLRLELRPLGVRLHLVCPGEFDSPMVDAVNAYRSAANRALVQTMPTLPAAAVADAVMAGVRRGRYLIVPGAMTRAVDGLNRFAPGLTRAFSDLTLARIQRKSGGG
jgi:3-dehydrosphinganine reductase